jgi:hypothetical protein
MDKKYEIGEPFLAMRFRMLTSKAYEDLSRTARLILNFLEIEYARSGGYKNGRLIAPRRRLIAFCGGRYATLLAGITELKVARFIKFRKGMPGPSGKGRSMMFGLTYAPTLVENPKDRDHPIVLPPTDEWDTTKRVVSRKSKPRNPEKSVPIAVPQPQAAIAVPEPQDRGDFNPKASEEMPVKRQLNAVPEPQDLDIYKPSSPEHHNQRAESRE